MRLTVTTRGSARWLAHPAGRILLTCACAAFVAGGVIFIHFYNVYASVIDARLSEPIFNQTSIVFAAPKEITTGEALTPDQLIRWLRAAGYSEDQSSPVGTFTTSGDMIAIKPGPEATESPTPIQLQFQNGTVAAMTDPAGQTVTTYALEPELLTSLFNAKREKRRLVHYNDLPPTLVQAVLDIEDREFFHHGAVNWWRVPSAVYRDVRSGRREQGASTITMQMARNIFGLGSQRSGWAGVKRKMAETVVAMELEERLTKEQIFELYANQLYLGERASYSIHGFGEAADAYFGKSVGKLNLQECALLAGIIHGPNPDSPYRHPERALRRRNEVLRAMLKAGSITPQQEAMAETSPLAVTGADTEGSDAPYFVDMVRDRVSEQLPERDLATQSYRIYTTIDPDLQEAAARAVAQGMKGVDQELAELRAHDRSRRHGKLPMGANAPAQVAMVAMDPHTGAVLALVGGRNYAQSQLNHALAERPTGSIFKPFVYATALETGLLPNLAAITQTSTVMDQPTVFEGGYAPKNFENKYYGQVTLRTALEHSLNNATITLAEQVGLQAVTDLAHAAGIVNAQPTPSEAIGTYNATPLDMASAYTVFANGGVKEMPRFVYSVQTTSGDKVLQPPARSDSVLDPRIAFLTTNLMESVLDAGTAVRVRASGYDAPAAGKTGSSRDAWFAGYTDNLLCVVWVGLDDYENLNIEGAHAALPIWTAFMKSALALPTYHNVQPFAPPLGVVAVKIDTASGQAATPLCPPTQVETDYFLEGTEPKQSCHLHPSPLFPHGLIAGATSLFHWVVPPAPPPPPPAAPSKTAPIAVVPPQQAAKPAPAKPPEEKKRGFFGKLLHAIGGGGGN
ncbi:MAG TPA: transglycosylase domain-containing protein [Terriglobales bacterium]|nr:transglycosylase domain-containing protein [Terriglobales bacterium]